METGCKICDQRHQDLGKCPLYTLLFVLVNAATQQRPGEKSYAIAKLGEVSVMNIQRLLARPSALGWDIIISHLLVVQHFQAAPANVRMQAAEIFDKIVSAAPRDVETEKPDIQKRVQEQVLKALSEQAEPQPRVQTSTNIDIRKAALDTLLRMLESYGHALVCGWTTIFNVLGGVCPSTSASAKPEHIGASSVTTGKGSVLVRVAFPSLQIICSDFLAALSLNELRLCITTLADFGRQADEVNVALTVRTLCFTYGKDCA